MHANFNHLINNSIPLFFLSWGLFYFYNKIAYNFLIEENRDQLSIDQKKQKVVEMESIRLHELERRRFEGSRFGFFKFSRRVGFTGENEQYSSKKPSEKCGSG